MARHYLKTWPEFYAAVRSGAKRYEIRSFDRPYAIGDELVLLEYEPLARTFSGRSLKAAVTFITEPNEWGLPPGLGVLGLAEPIEMFDMLPEMAAELHARATDSSAEGR